MERWERGGKRWGRRGGWLGSSMVKVWYIRCGRGGGELERRGIGSVGEVARGRWS